MMIHPSMALLAKLGSILVHVEELRGKGGEEIFDGQAIDALLDDPEVREWLEAMRKLALIPVPRNHR